MLEETSPRKSAKWMPTTTFAARTGHVHHSPSTEQLAGAHDEKAVDV
jgi:hypothetical protein